MYCLKLDNHTIPDVKWNKSNSKHNLTRFRSMFPFNTSEKHCDVYKGHKQEAMLWNGVNQARPAFVWPFTALFLHWQCSLRNVNIHLLNMSNGLPERYTLSRCNIFKGGSAFTHLPNVGIVISVNKVRRASRYVKHDVFRSMRHKACQPRIPILGLQAMFSLQVEW